MSGHLLQKFEYRDNIKSMLREIKNIFRNFLNFPLNFLSLLLLKFKKIVHMALKFVKKFEYNYVDELCFTVMTCYVIKLFWNCYEAFGDPAKLLVRMLQYV